MKKPDIIAVISLIRFILGGKAIFIDILSIHASEIIGQKMLVPPIIIMFRLPVFSYIIFVNRNIHDEVRPCVSIINSLEYWPSFEFDINLIIRSLICPTDE